MAEHLKTHIGGTYVIFAAIITGVFALIAANWQQAPPMAPSSNGGEFMILQVIPESQPVNGWRVLKQYFPEEIELPSRYDITTFNVTLKNLTETEMIVTEVEFVPVRIKRYFENVEGVELVRTLASFSQLNHDNDFRLVISEPKIDKRFSMGAEIFIPAKDQRVFRIWFDSQSVKSPMDIEGYLNLKSQSGGKVTKKMELNIRSE
ncbi:MAG: hypothetical protein WEB58_00235 [Planctomycetaceae bacterium]